MTSLLKKLSISIKIGVIKRYGVCLVSFEVVDRMRRQSSWASCELCSHRRQNSFVASASAVCIGHYLHSWLGRIKPVSDTGNISETVEDRAKATINGLYKVVRWHSIAAKMYDLEWPLSEIKITDSVNAAKNGEIQLNNDFDAMFRSCWPNLPLVSPKIINVLFG